VSRPLLLINPRSGKGGPSPEELAAAARERGVEARIVDPRDDPTEAARAADAGAIGIAGGDGSLAPVAAVAIERALPFVCVPFGTRNHFARDIGLDRDDPLAALDAFAGVERRVDVGRVDGRLFLNNVSLGLYARLVHRRERHRRRRETLARLRALAILVTRPRPTRVSVDGEAIQARVVVVANNAYETGLLSPGERASLDEGTLHLYTTRRVLRDGWEDRAGTRFVLDAPRHRLRAAIDGEPAVLETPVEFRVEPRALRLLVPPGL
jgi:diacylglycerol kinase family enzyme